MTTTTINPDFSNLKVGDTLKLNPRSLYMGVNGEDTVVVTGLDNFTPKNYVRTTAHHSIGSYRRDLWNFHPDSLSSHFLGIVVSEPATPQPQIFENAEEAARGQTIELKRPDSTAYIRVSANFHREEQQREAEKPIWLDIETKSGNPYTLLTIDEAKQVAVALFNQILYHESLRNKES